jgi:hypothetical protein
MGIEQDAAKDLSLSDDDAENVAGGKKTKKTAHKAAAKTYSVGYVNVPGSNTSGSTDSSGTTAWGDDCEDPSV